MTREDIEILLTEWEVYKTPRIYDFEVLDGMRLLINEFASIKQTISLPPAEGAGRIAAKKYLNSKGITRLTCYTDGRLTYYFDDLAKLMEEFATLHAQRLAEKMVEDELVAFLIKRDYPHAMQDECVMVMVRNIVSEYLKSRASHD